MVFSKSLVQSLYGLSDRQVEVCQATWTGRSAKEVGCLLFISDKTVKFHHTAIYEAMGVKSKAQMIRKIYQIHGQDLDMLPGTPGAPKPDKSSLDDSMHSLIWQPPQSDPSVEGA